MKNPSIQEDWAIILRFLPQGWQQKAVDSGALIRRRKIDSPETLLRLLLIHLADGKSLRTTVAYAKAANLCDINDVALLHRLKASQQWFRWMSLQLLEAMKGMPLHLGLSKRYKLRTVDGSIVNEPGATGSDWRLHFSFELNGLRCDSFQITGTDVGEDFQRYAISANDLMIGDRGYCKRHGITYVLDNGGQVLVRYHSSNLPLLTAGAKSYPILEKLRSLTTGCHGDWDVWYRYPTDGRMIKGRLCAVRKSKECIELSHKKLRLKASRQGRSLRPETLEFAEYVIVFTTVDRRSYKGEDILSLYRARWQIELVFKRLKSISGFGHLPKKSAQSCIAWLHGKLFVALLAERLRQEAEFFSPWGFPWPLPCST